MFTSGEKFGLIVIGCFVALMVLLGYRIWIVEIPTDPRFSYFLTCLNHTNYKEAATVRACDEVARSVAGVKQ